MKKNNIFDGVMVLLGLVCLFALIFGAEFLGFGLGTLVMGLGCLSEGSKKKQALWLLGMVSCCFQWGLSL